MCFPFVRSKVCPWVNRFPKSSFVQIHRTVDTSAFGYILPITGRIPDFYQEAIHSRFVAISPRQSPLYDKQKNTRKSVNTLRVIFLLI